jgi:hypothetical protein
MSAEAPIPVHGRGFTIPGGGVAEIIIIGGTPYPAAFIVQCVNSHAALVDLATELIQAIEEDKSIIKSDAYESDDASWFAERAREALKLAGA